MPAHVHVHVNADEATLFEWDAPDDEPLGHVIIVGHAGMVDHPVTELENEGIPIVIRIVSKDQSVDAVTPAMREPFEPEKVEKDSKDSKVAEKDDKVPAHR